MTVADDEPRYVSFITNNCTDGFPQCQRSKVRRPGHVKCTTLIVKRTPAGALDSLHLSAGDAERNPAPKQAFYICGGTTTNEGFECLMSDARCHKNFIIPTGNVAVQCQRLTSFVCSQRNSSAEDRDRSSV